MDWRTEAGTGLNYNQAVLNLESTVFIAYNTFSRLKDYVNFQNKQLNMYCIGHSMGSHFCGLLSKLFIKNLQLKFEKIAALGEFSQTENFSSIFFLN